MARVVEAPCARCCTSVLATRQAVWRPSCKRWPNIPPKVGRRGCFRRMHRVVSWPNGERTAELVESSAEDAGTQAFAPTWCTYTWPRIGRGVERAKLIRVAHTCGLPLLSICIRASSMRGLRRAAQSGTTGQRCACSTRTQGVVLSKAWKDRLAPTVGAVQVVENPLVPLPEINHVRREQHHLLLLARKDPIKGHGFAVEVAKELRKTFPELRLTMTGESHSEHAWVDAKGWVSQDEKASLIARSSLLLLPSAFEGQPVAALEALSGGLPVCVSDRVVGLPDTVKQAPWETWMHGRPPCVICSPIRRMKPRSVPRLQNMRLSKSSGGGKPSTNRFDDARSARLRNHPWWTTIRDASLHRHADRLDVPVGLQAPSTPPNRPGESLLAAPRRTKRPQRRPNDARRDRFQTPEAHWRGIRCA